MHHCPDSEPEAQSNEKHHVEILEQFYYAETFLNYS